MSTETTVTRMKPVIVLPPKSVSKADIKELRENGICVIVAKDPSVVRFIEPPPNGYNEQEKAAIKLCRYLVRRDNTASCGRQEIMALLAHFFIEGSPLQTVATVVTATVAATPKAK